MNAGKWFQVNLYGLAPGHLQKAAYPPLRFYLSEARMETYNTSGKQSYSGLSLEAKLNVDWADKRYRVPLKSPVYGNIPAEYAGVEMFEPKYL